MSQLYQYCMCQPMPTVLYLVWEFNADLHRFKTRSNTARSFENMVMAFSRAHVQNLKLKVLTQHENSGKMTASKLMDFAVTVAQFLKLLDAFIISATVRKSSME